MVYNYTFTYNKEEYMNDYKQIKAGDVVEYGDNNFAQVKRIRISNSPFVNGDIFIESFSEEDSVTVERPTLSMSTMGTIAVKMANESNIEFILNNGMYKTVKQIKAAYRKDEHGDLEKFYDKNSYLLYKKLGG